MSQKIRIKLRGCDHALVDRSVEKIVKTVKVTGAMVTGPVPMPTVRRVFTVLRSPHVNKKSREQFEYRIHGRLVDIFNSNAKTMDALKKLEIASGVEIELKA